MIDFEKSYYKFQCVYLTKSELAWNFVRKWTTVHCREPISEPYNDEAFNFKIVEENRNHFRLETESTTFKQSPTYRPNV